jgi:beta-glucanase (GH16 family)
MKIELIIASVCLLVQTSCNISENDYPYSKSWKTDFFDDFNHLDKNNWQEQKIWVNNEIQCYVDNGRFNTLEVSDGTLKLRVVKIDSIMPCDNHDKFGNQHPATNIVSSRICTKNKKEFIKGRWTARLKLKSNGMPSQFPAWWILGAQNNEAPVQEENENICWPLQGSGEIDIFEHHGDHMKDAFTTGRIVSLGDCDKGDWWSQRINVESRLSDFHEYSVEWRDLDLVYRLDGEEVFRNVGAGDTYTEPMFAILNYAKITENEMQGSWEMEVDWVKHEKQNL